MKFLFAVFKTFAGEVVFSRHCSYRKKKKKREKFLKHFFKSFRMTKWFLCNNSDQTWFSDTITCAAPLGRCWNPCLSVSGFSTYLRAQHMLMHRKSCLFSILVARYRLKIPSLGITVQHHEEQLPSWRKFRVISICTSQSLDSCYCKGIKVGVHAINNSLNPRKSMF